MNSWLLDGVTATNVEDGDLSSSVAIKYDDGFSTAWVSKTHGTYTVTYTVTDSEGNTVREKSTVTIYSSVAVHYVDESGNTIKPDAILSRSFGESFTVDTSDFIYNDKKYNYISFEKNPTADTMINSKIAKLEITSSGQTDANTLAGIFGSPDQLMEVTLIYMQNQQSISGTNYTMYIRNATPTSIDFNASATDIGGNTIQVTTDLSKVDLDIVGNYPVVLLSEDGQTLTVTLTISDRLIVNKALIIFDPNGGTTTQKSLSANVGNDFCVKAIVSSVGLQKKKKVQKWHQALLCL